LRIAAAALAGAGLKIWEILTKSRCASRKKERGRIQPLSVSLPVGPADFVIDQDATQSARIGQQGFFPCKIITLAGCARIKKNRAIGRGQSDREEVNPG
jgi:hypothetical protein